MPTRTRNLPILPADPFDSLKHRTRYWVGNINVFVNSTPVERHMAMNLHIQPNCTNEAMFFLGSGRDAYQFSIERSNDAWEVSLGRLRSDRTFIALNKWWEVLSWETVIVEIDPPENCEVGAVTVVVTQRSSRSTAKVEFSFDANAKGAGCYVLDDEAGDEAPVEEPPRIVKRPNRCSTPTGARSEPPGVVERPAAPQPRQATPSLLSRIGRVIFGR